MSTYTVDWYTSGGFNYRTTCENSILNHKGAVIVGKEHNKDCYRLVYRYMHSKGYYAIDAINVVKYEYDSYNIGDTVK